jgi:hypothetical protein
MFPFSWIIGGLTGGVLVAAANFIFYAWILPEVNATLGQGERITPFMVNFRLLEVLRRHAQLAPTSKRRSVMYILLGVGLFCVLAGVFLSLPLTRSI